MIEEEFDLREFLVDPEGRYNAQYMMVQEQMKNQTENNWNASFIAALQQCGLCISPRPTKPYHVRAPLPVAGYRPTWTRDAFIIEKPELHPLHPEKTVFMTERFGPDPDRVTGRTTALALRFIAQAIEQPHHLVILEDHHMSREGNIHLGRIVMQMIQQLGLQHMQVIESQKESYYMLLFKRKDIQPDSVGLGVVPNINFK